VARARESEDSRTLAQLLTGSRSQRLRQRGLHRLSTYGLLRALPRAAVERVIAVLGEVGFFGSAVSASSADGIAVTLTPDAIAVMKGERALNPRVAKALAKVVCATAGV
jgi:superfamily II DNA helicase RecQ